MHPSSCFIVKALQIRQPVLDLEFIQTQQPSTPSRRLPEVWLPLQPRSSDRDRQPPENPRA